MLDFLRDLNLQTPRRQRQLAGIAKAFSITDETVIFPGSEADDKDLASNTRKHLGDLAE